MKWLAVLLLTGCGCTTLPTERLRATTLRLQGTGICSGTAIGPDLVLTATHCLPVTSINGTPVEVTAVATSSRDTARLRIKGLTFRRWSREGAAPKQGDRLRWWGNPLGVQDVYREGYVAAVKGDQLIIDATICKGDSGSGLFNRYGEVVGVVSAMTDPHGCTFMIAWK